MKYEEFLERWNAVLVKVSWFVVPICFFIIAGHMIYPVVSLMLRE